MEGAANAFSYFMSKALSPRLNSVPPARMSFFHQQLSPTSKSRRKFKSHLKRLKDKMRPRDRIVLHLIDEITKSGCNPQSQSPLYKIPAEIREEIFSYVLSESDSKDTISQHDYWYRPDYLSFRFIDTNLLRTCRQVWVETYTLPRRNVSQRIWLGTDERRPPRSKKSEYLRLLKLNISTI
jgi:hypothetical protein